MKTRKRALLVKLESAYGTDPTPAAATDAVLAAALDPSSPLDQEFVERTLVRHFYGGFEQLPTRNYAGVQVDLEMAGFGSAGPASPTAGYDALMRSAALGSRRRPIVRCTKPWFSLIRGSMSWALAASSLTCFVAGPCVIERAPSVPSLIAV
jgi:hypothetical protein